VGCICRSPPPTRARSVRSTRTNRSGSIWPAQCVERLERYERHACRPSTTRIQMTGTFLSRCHNDEDADALITSFTRMAARRFPDRGAKRAPADGPAILLVRRDSGPPSPDRQRVDVVGALVSLHRLQIAHVPHDRYSSVMPFGSQQVAAQAGRNPAPWRRCSASASKMCAARPCPILQPAHLHRQQLPLW